MKEIDQVHDNETYSYAAEWVTYEIQCMQYEDTNVLDRAWKIDQVLQKDLQSHETKKKALKIHDNQWTTMSKSIVSVHHPKALSSLWSSPDLSNICIFNCSDMRLEVLPESLGQSLVNLVELTCARNALRFLPPSLGLCQSLRRLDLRSNQCQHLPTEISNCSMLRILKLADNPLPPLYFEQHQQGLLYVLSFLEALKRMMRGDDPSTEEDTEEFLNSILQDPRLMDKLKLIQQQCRLPVIERLVQRTIDSSNPWINWMNLGLSSFPSACFRPIPSTMPLSSGNFTFFRLVNLNGNGLRVLPETFWTWPRLERIEELHLERNALEEIPAGIQALVELKILLVGKNQLHFVSPELAKCTKLDIVDVSRNHLSQFPVLPQVRYYGQHDNPGASSTGSTSLQKSVPNQGSFDSEFSSNSCLKERDTGEFDKNTTCHSQDRHQHWKVFPVKFKSMGKLVDLNLSHNHIAVIPNWLVSHLCVLRRLNMDHNDLTTHGILPLVQCLGLQVLSLNHNHLSSIDTLVLNARSCLQYLNVSHNHIGVFPKADQLSTQWHSIVILNNPGTSLGLQRQYYHVVLENRARNRTLKPNSNGIIDKGV